MRTVDEHAAALLGMVCPGSVSLVPLDRALGRALAEDLVAGLDLPPWDSSAMDGYAVRRADVVSGRVVLHVVGDAPAGDRRTLALAPGTAVRIMTGAPVPSGADALVPVERTDGGIRYVRLDEVPVAGAHLRRTGEDVGNGAVALMAGTVLGPAQIGLAAALGHARLPVRRRPTVAVVSTGSELVAPGDDLGPGQIFDSNGPQVAAAVRAAGARVVRVEREADPVGRVLALLDRCAAEADLVLTTGGVSAGAHDVVKEGLRATGTVEFNRVAMQPGKPQGAGRLRETPVVTLPGNPVSAFVSFEVFVRPMIRAMLGARLIHRPVRAARLTAPITSPAGCRQYVRGRWDAEGCTATVTPVGGSGSHLLGSLARSDALVVIPEDSPAVRAGSEVAVMDLRGDAR